MFPPTFPGPANEAPHALGWGASLPHRALRRTSSKCAVKGRPIDLQVPGHLRLRHPGLDQPARVHQLLGGELLRAALVLAGRLGKPDALALPLTN